MRRQPPLIAVARPSKRAAVQAHVRERGWGSVGRGEWEQLRAAFPGVSETTVRAALSELGIAMDQPFAGVVTTTLEELERSLLSMADAYPANRGECRAVVIAAKDRCRFAAQNQHAAEEKRALKQEMVEWMLVWLGDPAMFGAWVSLRKPLLQQQ